MHFLRRVQVDVKLKFCVLTNSQHFWLALSARPALQMPVI
jgi:hypothetical protein